MWCSGFWRSSLLFGLILLFVVGLQPAVARSRASYVRVGFLVGEGVHEGELLYPLEHLRELGVQVTVIGVDTGTVMPYNSDTPVEIDSAIGELAAENFDGLVIPGGRSPENLRENAAVLQFVAEYAELGFPLAAICHGPQLLAAADLLEGRKITAYPGIEEEMLEAGAEFIDDEVVVDVNFITSRGPDDLPAFTERLTVYLIEE